MKYVYSILLLILSINYTSAQQIKIGGAEINANKNIIDNLLNSSDHFTFLGLLKAAGMIETLRQAGPYTLFAPTDAAFDKLSQEKMDKLMNSGNNAELRNFVNTHLAKGRITMQKGTTGFSTLSGNKLKINKESRLLMVNGQSAPIKINTADVMVKNGIIQVIGAVILP